MSTHVYISACLGKANCFFCGTECFSQIVAKASKTEPHFSGSALAIAKVAKLRFYICGFRGDWKALRQLFNLSRDYSRNEAGFEETKIQTANCFLDCVWIFVVAKLLFTLSDLLALPGHQRQRW